MMKNELLSIISNQIVCKIQQLKNIKFLINPAGHIYLSEVAGTVDDPRCPDCMSSEGGPTAEEEMGDTA